jgi:hypothetical protein
METLMQRAVCSFFASLPDGTERYVQLGETLADDDPITRGREVFFQAASSDEPKPARRATRPKKTDPKTDQ